MAISEVRSPELSKPLGIFSQATRCDAKGQLLFISGLTARDREGNVAVPGLHDGAALVAWLDERGLDEALVSVPPPLFAEDAGWLNDGLAETVAAHPGRLRALAFLPIADPPRAVAEASRRRGDPWAGAVIASSAGERTLADRELEPLWEALDGSFVLVHPGEAPDPRLDLVY